MNWAKLCCNAVLPEEAMKLLGWSAFFLSVLQIRPNLWIMHDAIPPVNISPKTNLYLNPFPTTWCLYKDISSTISSSNSHHCVKQWNFSLFRLLNKLIKFFKKSCPASPLERSPSRRRNRSGSSEFGSVFWFASRVVMGLSSISHLLVKTEKYSP